MREKQRADIGFFEKYLTVWVIVCMLIGILISKFMPIYSTYK